jgi:hypothetical protein
VQKAVKSSATELGWLQFHNRVGRWLWLKGNMRCFGNINMLALGKPKVCGRYACEVDYDLPNSFFIFFHGCVLATSAAVKHPRRA